MKIRIRLRGQLASALGAIAPGSAVPLVRRWLRRRLHRLSRWGHRGERSTHERQRAREGVSPRAGLTRAVRFDRPAAPAAPIGDAGRTRPWRVTPRTR